MTPQDRPKRIALLIDADNSPASKIDHILTELAIEGVANVRRAYGNWKKDALKGWEKLLHEHAIRPMQQFDYSKGKNASDMAMVIDALELLYTDKPDAFGIVSSDADFTPLVMHLRAKGAAVYGFGTQQAPKPFVAAKSLSSKVNGIAAAPRPVLAQQKQQAHCCNRRPASTQQAMHRRIAPFERHNNHSCAPLRRKCCSAGAKNMDSSSGCAMTSSTDSA